MPMPNRNKEIPLERQWYLYEKVRPLYCCWERCRHCVARAWGAKDGQPSAAPWQHWGADAVPAKRYGSTWSHCQQAGHHRSSRGVLTCPLLRYTWLVLWTGGPFLWLPCALNSWKCNTDRWGKGQKITIRCSSWTKYTVTVCCCLKLGALHYWLQVKMHALLPSDFTDCNTIVQTFIMNTVITWISAGY